MLEGLGLQQEGGAGGLKDSCSFDQAQPRKVLLQCL